MDTKRNQQIALSANGKRLLSSDFTRIEVWDVTLGKWLRELEDVPETKLPPWKLSEHAPPLTYFIGSLAVSPDATKAAATYVRKGTECSLYLWDIETGKKIAGWPGDNKFRGPIAFSPDGKVLAAVQKRNDREGNLVLWDLAKGEIVQRLPITDSSCSCMAFSRNGALVAVGGYYTCMVQVFEVATGKEIAQFKPHEESPTLTFSDDGTTLLTGSADSTILIWDLHSPALQKMKN